MADLVLPRGKVKVLKAEDNDYDRGLLVKLLDDGGYKMAYWYNKPNKPNQTRKYKHNSNVQHIIKMFYYPK